MYTHLQSSSPQATGFGDCPALWATASPALLWVQACGPGTSGHTDPQANKWLIAFGTVVNCHKPVIWEWIESCQFSWFLGYSRMVYDMGFTTLSTIHFGGLVILSQQSPVPTSPSVSPSQLARYQSRHNKPEKTGDASVDVLIESTVCSISLKKQKQKNTYLKC